MEISGCGTDDPPMIQPFMIEERAKSLFWSPIFAVPDMPYFDISIMVLQYVVGILRDRAYLPLKDSIFKRQDILFSECIVFISIDGIPDREAGKITFPYLSIVHDIYVGTTALVNEPQETPPVILLTVMAKEVLIA